MKYADTPNGNHGEDDSLKAIEDEDGFGIPGQSAVGTVGTNTGGPGGSDTHMTSGEDTTRISLDPLKDQTIQDLLGLREFGGVSMSLAARIAYVMENGEPFCNHCEKNYLPLSLGVVACTNCGCGKPNDDHGALNNLFSHVEGPTATDEDAGHNIVKTQSYDPLEDTDDYIIAFTKESNDSQLYYQGFNDAMAGKPLNEDLAVLSDDYYNGYEQHKFYNKSPQESVGQTTFDIKPNSNQISRTYDGKLKPEDVDRGPLQLTDGMNSATASKLPFPTDVIQKFFEA